MLVLVNELPPSSWGSGHAGHWIFCGEYSPFLLFESLDDSSGTEIMLHIPRLDIGDFWRASLLKDVPRPPVTETDGLLQFWDV